MQPGSSATLCVQASQNLSSADTLSAQPAANSSPHFDTYSSTIVYPAGTVAQECFTLTADNVQASQLYSFELQSSDGTVLDSFPVFVSVNNNCDNVAGDAQVINAGDSVLIGADCLPAPYPFYGANYNYEWSPITGLSDPYSAQTFATPDTTTLYTLSVTSNGTAVTQGQITVTVNPPIDTTNSGDSGTTPSLPSVPEALEIRAKAASDGNRALIRWAPLDEGTWAWGNAYGYRLDRITVSNSADTSFSAADMFQSRVVLDSQLLALPEADWETYADSNQFAGLAAAAIYGEGFAVQDINAQSGIVQAYNTNREQENRFGFSLFTADQSFEVAEMMGLGYVDETVEPNKRYIYRLYLNEVPDSVAFERAIVGFSLEDTLALPQPSRIEAMPKDSAVLLAWSRDAPDALSLSSI